MKGVRRLAAAVLFVLLASPVTPASAHAAYKESNPANKSSVSAPPSEVWAEFTEPPARSSRLEIYDPCGSRVDAGTWNITAYRITTSMNSDKAGTYTARFYVTSDLDSHVTTGSFNFTSTGGEPCPGAAEEPKVSQEKPSDDGGGGGDASEGSGDEGPTFAGSSSNPGDTEEGTAGNAKDQPGKHEGMNHKSKKKHGKGDHKSKGKDSKNRNKSSASGPPVQGGETPPGSGDIPMDWLMISFGIAGAVGAAGGKVYAGLMGGPKS